MLNLNKYFLIFDSRVVVMNSILDVGKPMVWQKAYETLVARGWA